MYTIAIIRPLGSNIGNAAINFALRNMLYDTFGRLVSIIEYPATNKHESNAIAGITPPTVHELNRVADAVIVGGGNLFENDELDVDFRALRALQPPLMLFSNSRGRIYDRHGNWASRSDVMEDTKLAALLERADLSISRDSATHDHLARLNGKDVLGWCPTLNLGKYTDRIPGLPKSEQVGALISVRSPSLMNIPYRLQSQVQGDIERAIDALRESGHERVRILCNDRRDLDFATAFRYTKSVDSIHAGDVYEYLALLREASIVVSYRLHASLPALSFGTRAVNIVYDERAKALMEDVGLADGIVNMVEGGDDFSDELTSWIERGGYRPDAEGSLRARWNEIADAQFGFLESFRSLATRYLQTGRR